jgi:restriction system protein
MALRMAKNSLFAILLRSPWWVSLLIALALGLLSFALLPQDLRVVGAVSGLPFVVIAFLALRRQWRLPSAAKVAETHSALSALGWPAFAELLQQSFRRDGYSVEPGEGGAVDFAIERRGRRMLVCARRWKSARIGMESLRVLQVAREAAEVPDALYIGLGSLTDGARSYAAEHRVVVWQSAELAEALRGLPLR